MALGVDQDHMLHICAQHQQTLVGVIIFVYTVVAYTTPHVIASASLKTKGRNPGQHQGISIVMDHTTEQIPKIWEFHKEIHRILHIPEKQPLKIQEITPQLDNRYTQVVLFPYRDYNYRDGLQQNRFDKRYNKQYSPNYNHYTHQPSPLVSIAGPDLNDTLIYLANIQSRSLDLMVAYQKSQEDVYKELTRANKDKSNKAMLATINTCDGVNRGMFEEWINELDQVCRISAYDFRIKIIRKLIETVCKVLLTTSDCSDNQLLANLRSCFSDAPMMNQAREDLRNMRQ